MPIEDEFEQNRISIAERLVESSRFRVYSVENSSRRFISLESSEESLLMHAFEIVYETLEKLGVDDDEPMMNIISTYSGGEWRVIIFPRAKHRPSIFFEEDERRILISPAAVDLGGVCITQLEKDFEKITKEDIALIFDEVCLSERAFRDFTSSLKQNLTREAPHS